MNDSFTAPSLLKRIIDTSRDGIVVYESVRDSTGNLTDLRVIMANEQAEKLLNRSVAVLIGQLYTQLFPTTIGTDQFLKTYAVVSTGQPFDYEIQSSLTETGSRWYTVSVAKLDDGLLISFADITDQKRAELGREELLNLLEGVFASSLLGITVYETVYDTAGAIIDFRLQHINDAGLRMAGNPVGWVEGRMMKELNPASGAEDGLFHQYVAVCQTGESFQTERYYPAFTSWYTIMATKWANGIVLTYQDITDRKRNEQNYQHQADTFAGVLRSMTNGLAVFSVIRDEQDQLADLRYDYVSDHTLNETDMTREQYVGQRLLTLFPGTRHSRFWQAYEDTLRTGQPQIFEEHYHFDGYDNYLYCQVTRLDEDRLVSIYQNTNELHQARQQIQRQAEMLQIVVDNTQAGLLLITPIRDHHGSLDADPITDFRVLLTNRYNAERAGKTVAGMNGQLLGDLFAGWQSSDLFGRFVDVVETEINQRLIFPYTEYSWNGWYDGSFTKVGDALLYTYIDVTSLKEAELNQQQQAQALEMANLELKRSNDNLQSFAYVASHDLQEPLRKIQAFGDLLVSQYESALDQTGRDYIDRMQTAAGRMSLLIKDLLVYSRLSMYQEPYKPVNLTDLINSVLADLDLTIHESGAIITQDELPTVMGDSMQLRQLFQNLLTNALKFRQPNQRPAIRINTRRIQQSDLATDTTLSGFINQSNAKARSLSEISISDNGIGFDVKYIDRIFQVFQRLHGRSHYDGSGVGLAICKRVAENHGGTIQASSRPGEGATFRVYLPI